MFSALVCLLPVLLPPSMSSPGDWPQWRGPDHDNVSKETGWSPTGGAEALWTAQIGTGYSSPVIADGRVIINGYFDSEETPGEGTDRVSCLDALTGELLWARSYDALIYDNEHAGGALSTATIADGTVYVASRQGGLRAYSLEDGELLWEVDLVERHEVDPSRYGFASSPYVHGDQLILNADRTLAIERVSGATIWISEEGGASYSTVRPIQLGDTLGFVAFGSEGLTVFAAEDGALLKNTPFRRGNRNVEGATPIVIGTQVFISSGYEQGGMLVDFAPEEPEVLWRTRRMRNKMAGSTLWQGHFYGFDESMLKCIDMQGQEQWRVRGLGHGALSIADGYLLTTTSKGELVVAMASPEGFEELSRTKLIDHGVFWAAPALSNGLIYIRGSLGDLACVDHSAGSASEGGAAAAEVVASADLPSAADLQARHLSLCGLDDDEAAGREPLPGLIMSGKLFVKALGLDNVDALWELNSDGRWHVLFDLPPTMEGSIQSFFNGELGWDIGPTGRKSLMKPRPLAELKSLGGPRCLLAPLPVGAQMSTAAKEFFHDVECYRVDVELGEGVVRHVYFDVETGRLYGRSSEKEYTVLFSDWREVEGRTLPFRRTEFDPESGEEGRWVFDKVELKAPAEELFEVPEEVLEQLAKQAEDAEEEQESEE
jgi:outer membrane protein assembly factor BamB